MLQLHYVTCLFLFFFQAEDGIRDAQESRGLGDVYKRQVFDNENLYTDGAVSAAPAQTYLRVEVQPPSGENLGIESGYEISLRYDGGRELNVCLPDLRAHYTAKLYVGADGSTWWDQGLHVPAHAACAASPTPTPTPTAPPITFFVDFMPPELDPPAGWTKDDGEPYGTHGGWGWI